jgi:hypothetical protein
MVIEEAKESAGVPETETGALTDLEERTQKLVEEAAEFIARQVLDRGATFR